MIFSGASDWNDAFLPAVLALLNNGDVYGVSTFFNVPWALFPLIPFALLPYEIGRILLFGFTVATFGFLAWRFRAKPLGMGAFLLSPLVVNALTWGNVEWLTMLGLVAAPPVGILLLLIKPQMTFAVILFMALEAFRRGGVRAVARLAIIPSIAVLLSFGVYGLWFARWSQNLASANFNTSLSFFPWSIPVGAALLIIAALTRHRRYAVGASPCFFPVLSVQAWTVFLLMFVRSTPVMVISTIVMWIVVLFMKGILK